MIKRHFFALLLTLCTTVSVWAQNISVRGVVTDDKKEPLIGVSVRIKGTNKGTFTNLDGVFVLNNLSKTSILEFTYTGMASQTIAVDGRTTINVVMTDTGKELSDVVVVGYGRQKRVNLTGAVSSVDSKQLSARPVQNVGQILQGMIPGLNLSTNSGGGALDSRMSMNIRGAGTIGEGSNSGPLVLIDDVEGDMNTLSPNDIENISVLKDASSSSIYGSRAAFGVVLITTKSGREGKMRFNYNGSLRFSTATQVPDMMDSEMFANYFNRAALNSGSTAVFDDTTLQRIKDYKSGKIAEEFKYGTIFDKNSSEYWTKYGEGWANTDWFEYFYNKGVPSHEHNVSFSGGSDKISYYISGGYLGQKGLLKVADDHFNRYNLTAKINAKLTKWIEMNYTYRWTREDYERPTYMTSLFYHNIVRRWPTNATHDPNGFIMPHNEALQLIHGGRRDKQTDFYNQQLTFTLRPIDGLMVRIENNYNTTNNNTHVNLLPVYWHNDQKIPRAANWDDWTPGGTSYAQEVSEKRNFFSGRYYAEFAREYGKHDIKVVGGVDMDISQYRNINGTKKDLITVLVPTLNTATNDKPSLSGGYNHWATMGMFARLNYVYDERYLAEFSIRRDGSSRFIGNKRWATFPSFSLGWNLANERFFSGLKKHISQFKLRGSWGALGNTNIEALYPWYLNLPVTGASTTNGSTWLINGNRQTIAGAPGIVSDELTWERVVSWNAGFDFAVFNNRLQGSFDYFTRNTTDMVGPSAPMTSLLGTARPKTNNADLRSKGWELELRWRDQIGDLRYGAKIILSDNIIEVTKYYNPSGALNSWYAGKRQGDIWGYETIGIAQSDDEMNEHLKNNKHTWGNQWAAGDIMYKDLNGDKKVDAGSNTLADHGDLRIIGNSSPRYNFSFTGDLSYKGFDFSFMLQGIAKRDFFTDEPYFVGANTGKWQSVAFVEHWDFWRPENDPLGANKNAYYPRVAFGASKNFQTQTRYLLNASYIRIKNLQLGYTLPTSLTKKLGVGSLRVYASVDNLATITSLSKIFDPEGLNNGGWGTGKLYPLQRTWSFGLNVNI